MGPSGSLAYTSLGRIWRQASLSLYSLVHLFALITGAWFNFVVFGLPTLLVTITSSFQAVNYSVHHLPFFSHFSKWRKHSERGRLAHGNSGHTSIPGSRHELQAGTTPFLATARRRFPSKNPPDRLPVFQKSRSRNEFLADLLRPHAVLVGN